MRVQEILKPVSIPDSYARTTRLEEKQTDINRLPIRLAYQKTWERNLRILDDNLVRERIANVRNTLRGSTLDQHQSTIATYWDDVENSSYFSVYQQAYRDCCEKKGGTPPPTALTYSLLINSIMGENEHEKTFAHETFFQQLKEMGADRTIIAYITSLFYYHNSRLIALHTVENGLKSAPSPTNRFFTYIYLKTIMQKAEPYVKRAEQLSGQVRTTELLLFGPNARLAGRLWRTCLFLKTKTLPPDLSASEVRRPLLEALLNRKYDEAKAYVKKIIAYNPNLVQDFTKETLDSIQRVPVEQSAAGDTSATTDQDKYLPVKLADLAKECGVPKGTISRRVRKLLQRHGNASGIQKTRNGYRLTKEAMESVRTYEKWYRTSQSEIPKGYEKIYLPALTQKVGYSLSQTGWHIKKIRSEYPDEFRTINTPRGKCLCVTPQGRMIIESYFRSLSKTR